MGQVQGFVEGFGLVEITDQEGARDWLEDQTREIQVAFAARCALRAFSGVGAFIPDTPGFIALPTARAVLTGAIAAVRGDPRLEVAANSAGLEAGRKIDAAYDCAAIRAAAAALSAYVARSSKHSVDAALRSLSLSDAPFKYDSRSDLKEAYSAARKDAVVLARGSPELVFNTRLWPEETGIATDLVDAFSNLRALWQGNPATWGFWERWYFAMLSGRPLPWALQCEVALIPDEVWEAGAEAVAAEIAKIEARFELEARIEDLEKASLVTSNRYGIGGNQPPEPIEPEKIQKEITIIWAGIDDLKTEVAKPEPDKRTVERIIAVLSSGSRAILALGGRMAEHAAKVAITVTVTAGVTRVINPDLLDVVIKAAKAWLAAL